jgi:hypothetical protein
MFSWDAPDESQVSRIAPVHYSTISRPPFAYFTKGAGADPCGQLPIYAVNGLA